MSHHSIQTCRSHSGKVPQPASRRRPHGRPISFVLSWSCVVRFFSLQLINLVAEDSLVEVLDVCVEELVGGFISRLDLSRRTLDLGRIVHAPIKAHDLGWAYGKGPLCLGRQGHNDLVVVEIWYLIDRLARLLRDIQALAFEELDRPRIDGSSLDASAG